MNPLTSVIISYHDDRGRGHDHGDDDGDAMVLHLRW